MNLDRKLGSCPFFLAQCTPEPDGLAGRSRDEQTLLQFISCSVHLLECVDITWYDSPTRLQNIVDSPSSSIN